MQPSFYKMFSERARESALRVRRHQSALGASATPGGMTPAIAARVKEILAGKAGKKKGGKAKAKGKSPKQKQAEAAKKLAERTAKQAAAKEAREKAKAERVTAATAKKQEAEKTKAERVAAQQAKQAEATKKKEAAIAKAKQGKKKAGEKAKPSAPATAKPAKPASAAPLPRSKAPTISGGGGSAAPKAPKADPAVARAKNVTAVADATGLGDHLANLDKFKAGGELNEKDANELEKRGLVERGTDGTVRMSSAGTALIAAAARGDTRAAQDAVSRAKDKKVTKAIDDNEFPPAIKQTDQERAMFAAMGESGSLRPQNSKGNRPKPRKGGGGGGGGASSSSGGGSSGSSSSSGGAGASSAGSSSSSSSSSSTGGGPGGRATLHAPVSGDMAAHARFVETKQKIAALRKEQRVLKTKVKQTDAKLNNHDRMAKLQDKKNRIDALGDELRSGGLTLARTREIGQALRKIRAEKALLEDFIMDETEDELAIKTGARHSAGDATHLNEAAKHLHAAGATCPDCPTDQGDDADPSSDAAIVAIKGIMDDPGYYAQHECQDILQACGGLQTIAMLIQSELGEDDEDPADITELCNAADILIEFIQGELDEVRGASKEDAKTIGHEPMKAIQELVEDLSALKSNVTPEVSPSSADKAIDEILDANGYMSIDFAVKSVGDGDEISGPAIRFGSASEPDISRERDYFTKSTNFWLDAWDKRPMIWHHALPQDDLITSLREAGAAPEEIKAMREAISYLDAHPMIGMWTKAVADPATVWMNGILDKAHRYRSAIKRMVELGMLKISTDSLPQLVVRERQPNGTHEVKSWPIVAASLTPTAAEPRLLDVSSMKLYYEEAGIAFPFDEKPEVKAEPDRARALLIELDLLELESSLGIPVS